MIRTVSLWKMTAKAKPIAIAGVESTVACKKVMALSQEMKVLAVLFYRAEHRIQL